MKPIDVTKMVGLMGREVRDSEREGKPARSVRASRVYDTDLADAWDALTNPERIPRWFLPVEGELRLGGRYQLKGNAGGTITACEPPRHFAATWEFGGGISWIDVRLESVGAQQTRLTLEHTAPIDPHWEKFGPGAVGVGWDLGLLGLALHLAARQAEGGSGAIDPAAFEAWSATDEGKQFARLSSDDWCRAAIAGGADPTAARAAADQTTAFYTGSAA